MIETGSISGGRSLGGRWFDLAAVDDLSESGARGVVVDVLGRIRAGRGLVGAGNRDELDVDLHVGGFSGRRRGARAREGSASRRRGQRLRESERGCLMAIFALNEYARDLGGI